MERIPAACAMDWSIELDKGLRSTIPGKSVEETIREIGCRLEWWSREHKLTMAEYDTFGLIPGEDKLFANAILLRLADAFVSGCRLTKICVVRLFLSEFKQRKRKRHSHKRYEGFLSNCDVDYMEFLRRVKMGFDGEDVEVRALTLVLFGCFANFAKDIAGIRYLILSSAVSCHDLEVKAALFAAGCFSELSDDFGSVFLEILINIMSSFELSVACRLAGAHAFAKLGCSASLASIAHKKGLKLVLDSAEEDLSVAMLISLSKVASKSTNSICEQIDLLLSYLNQDKTSRLQATSLKCLHFMVVKGVHHIPVTADVINTLFSMFNGAKIPPAMQIVVLQILYKILLYKQLSFCCTDMLEFFTKLLTIAESVISSPIISARLLTVRLLSDIAVKVIGRAEMSLNGVNSTLVDRAISFVMDRISIIGKLTLTLEFHQTDLRLNQEVRSLLNLIMCLVEESPDIGNLVLDKIYLFIDYLVNNKDNGIISTDKKELIYCDLNEVGRDYGPFTISKLVIYLCKVVAFCLENLEKIGAFTPQLHNLVKLTGELIYRCSLFDGYAHTICSLLLRPHIAYYSIRNETDENNIQDKNLSTSDRNCNFQYEMLLIEGARKIFSDKKKWSAYKVGKCAASQGAWSTAAFIFGQLITSVQSDSCRLWLKFLQLLAYSEMTVQFLLPNQRSSLVNWLEVNMISILLPGDDLHEKGETFNFEMNSTNFIENLVGACKILHLSGEILGGIVLKSNPLFFQKWFLALRIRVLGNVVDILNLLGTITLTQHNIISEGQVNGPVEIASLTQSLRQISTRLNKLASEFDLVATSFIGMGQRSSMIISELALSCSILAFSTEFTLSFPKVRSSVNGLENSVERLQVVLIQDLLVRSRDTNHETSKQLCSLLKAYYPPQSCYISQSETQRQENDCEVGSIYRLCTYAVSGVIGLQNEANSSDINDKVMFEITNGGLQLLLNISLHWMNIPFRIPTFFFQVRPSIWSQLFASDSNWESGGEGISVLPGCHLPLNLCLQLSNIPQDFQVRRTKLYCILYCKPSFLLPCRNGEKKTQTQLDYQDMLDLNEKLVQYVSGCSKISGSDDRDNTRNSGIVETYACFEPNEKGQGFSTCLLDVSGFPLGSYKMKWHSCCVDSKGSYWSLPSLNEGPVFNVHEPDDSI